MPNTVTDAETLISEIIPTTEVEKLEHGRTAEILQPLLDLGYIKEAKKEHLAQGILSFRKEYLSLNLIPDFAPRFLFLPPTELEGEELSLLHTLTAMDGDFTIEVLPLIGEVNIISRIIHYRLTIHQFYHLETETAFSEESLKAIQKPKEWIKNLPKNPLDLINLLGNIPDYIQHINKDINGGLNKRIVAFKYHSQNPDVNSKFKVEIPETLEKKIEEDDQEKDSENEQQMLHLENEVDDDLDDLQEQAIFDIKEQAALKKDARKNRRKRSRLLKIDAMTKVVHAEMNRISDEINAESDQLTDQINSLKKTLSKVNNESFVLISEIKSKKITIINLSKSKKGLKKKQRQLKRKIRRGAPQSEIDQLRLEIKRIKNADREIERIQIERSTLTVKLIPIQEDINGITRKLKSLQTQLDKLIDQRQDRINQKQSTLKALLVRLDLLEKKVNKIRFSFRGRLRKVLNKSFYENEIRDQIFRNRNGAILEKFCADEYNNYLIRLVQIFQWTNGFYYGKLDSSIGNRTFSALDDMATYSKGLRLKFILSKLSENHQGTKGYWILNIKYLFRRLSKVLIHSNSNFTTKDLLEHYEKEVQHIGSRGKVGNDLTNRCYDEIVEENQSDIKEDGMIRRIYYGIKSIASTLFNAFKQLLHIIKSGIEKLIYLLKNLIKIVYKEIREGIRKFRDGMKFLFGKRQFATAAGTDSAIITKYDFDFDATTFSPPEVSKKEMETHSQTLLRFSNNLDFTLVLTGKILKWALKLVELGTPIGWAKLALKIAIHYKSMIINWLVNLGKSLRQHCISIKYKPTPPIAGVV